MSTVLYFAYGSNLHPERLRRRTPSARPLGTHALSGWALRFHKRGHDGSGKCNVVQTGHHADAVHGAVYEIAADERVHLDRAEALGQGYDLHRLELAGYGETFLYVAAAPYIDDGLAPYHWYKDFVVTGARWHDLPAAYIRRLECTVAHPDPEAERHAENVAILASLEDAWCPGRGRT